MEGLASGCRRPLAKDDGAIALALEPHIVAPELRIIRHLAGFRFQQDIEISGHFGVTETKAGGVQDKQPPGFRQRAKSVTVRAKSAKCSNGSDRQAPEIVSWPWQRTARQKMAS